MATPAAQRARPGWAFWLQWTLGTTIGSAAGLGLASAVYLVLELTQKSFDTLLGTVAINIGVGAGFGAAGIPQVLVLRRYLDRVGIWAWALLATCAAGVALTSVLWTVFSKDVTWLPGFGATALGGAILQWITVLRRQVGGGGWWAAASMAGFLVAFLASVVGGTLIAARARTKRALLRWSVLRRHSVRNRIGAIFGLVLG